MALVVVGVALLACFPETPLSPKPGIPPYAQWLAYEVPGGKLNLANGNLLLQRDELDLDTPLGKFAVQAFYNSADGIWRWGFDLSYDGQMLVDPTGVAWSTGGIFPGLEIQGSGWLLLGDDELQTRGGLVHEFEEGKLSAIHWGGVEYPRWAFRRESIVSNRISKVELCEETSESGEAGESCSTLVDVTYDSAGRVSGLRDRAGREVEYGYDALGRLTTARDPFETETGLAGSRYEYATAENGVAQLSAHVSSEAERVEFGYDAANHVASVRRVGEGDPTFLFDYENRVGGLYATVVTDPRSGQSRYTYSVFWQLESFANAAGETTSYTWNGYEVASRTDAAGLVTTWDWRNEFLSGPWAGYYRVVTRNDPSGNRVTATYNPIAHNTANPAALPLLLLEDSLGVIERRTYDPWRRLLTRIENGAGEGVSFSGHAYTKPEFGENSAFVSSDRGGFAVLSFDPQIGHTRFATVSGALGYGMQQVQLPESIYDAVGNLLVGEENSGALSPARPGIVARAFDANREVASLDVGAYGVPTESGEETSTVAIERRSDGQPLRITRPYGGDTEFDYDELGRAVSRRERVDGAWVATLFEYDGEDRVTAVEMANGMRTEYVYDAAGREIERRHLRNGQIEKSLQTTWQNGRVVSRQDSSDAEAELLEYDAAGRVSAVSYPGGERIETDYDLRGRTLAQRWIAAQGSLLRTLEKSYDAAGRLATLSEDGVTLLQYEFPGEQVTYTTPQGQWHSVFEDRITYGNGLTRTFSRNVLSGGLMATRTESASATLENTTVQWEIPCVWHSWEMFGDYTRDCLRITETELWGGDGSPTELYVFSSGHPVEWGGLTGLTILGRPEAGLRVAESGSTKWLGYLTPSEGYFYDELNNRAGSEFLYNAERNRLLTAGNGTYDYDEAGFLVSSGATWDAMGLIRSIDGGGGLGVDEFAWDSLGRPLSRTVSGVTTRYLFGGRVEADAAGTPTALDLGEVRLDLATGGHLYRHFDFRGNVQFTSGDEGGVWDAYSYTAYGEITGGFSSGTNRRTFAQGEELGDVIRLGVRLYDPEVGRFLSPDPIYQVLNQYSYADGDPVNLWDPDGRMSFSVTAQAQAKGTISTGGAGGAAISASGSVSGSDGEIAGFATDLSASYNTGLPGATAEGSVGTSISLKDIEVPVPELDFNFSPPPPNLNIWFHISVMAGFMFWNG